MSHDSCAIDFFIRTLSKTNIIIINCLRKMVTEKSDRFLTFKSKRKFEFFRETFSKKKVLKRLQNGEKSLQS